jgi:hypothetical protein
MAEKGKLKIVFFLGELDRVLVAMFESRDFHAG